jgi:hypothetical protein
LEEKAEPMITTMPTPMPTVTLKLNGKAFRCTGQITKRKRCKSKSFFVAPPDETNIPMYSCVVCASTRFGGPNSGIEENVAMRNDWRTPGGTKMAPQPGKLWTTLDEEYGFNVDAAADAKNRKTPIFFGPEDGSDPEAEIPDDANGLTLNWFGDDLFKRVRALRAGLSDFEAAPLWVPKHIVRVEDVRAFWNCPYNPKGSVETWLRKALEQAALGVFSVGLIPMATSVAWFNDLVVPFAEWHSFKGRIPFEDPEPDAERTSPKQDNLLVIYNPNSNVIGHTAVRDADTGKKVWVRP